MTLDLTFTKKEQEDKNVNNGNEILVFLGKEACSKRLATHIFEIKA